MYKHKLHDIVILSNGKVQIVQCVVACSAALVVRSGKRGDVALAGAEMPAQLVEGFALRVHIMGLPPRAG